MVTRDLTIHSKTAHKNKFDKLRQLDTVDEEQMEMEIANDENECDCSD